MRKTFVLLKKNDAEFYKFHSGAPKSDFYNQGVSALKGSIDSKLNSLNLGSVQTVEFDVNARKQPNNAENLIRAYEDELVKLGANKDIVVLDADLTKDCGLISFKNKYPERFIECGIAEQDMVSLAGGLALRKKIPIVHSFACFLSTRPNEHIYNNASEETKIIYSGSLAGLLPATPGHSHQSVRDISALGSIPKLSMIQPANESETRLALNWAVKENEFSTYIRLVSIPCEIPFKLPEDYILAKGRGARLVTGGKIAIIAYGPVMLSEAFKAAGLLKEKDGIEITVINFPWLNEFDDQWLFSELKDFTHIITLDDHYLKLGQGCQIRSVLAGKFFGQHILSLGLDDIPKCGQIAEILSHYHFNAESLRKTILEIK